MLVADGPGEDAHHGRLGVVVPELGEDAAEELEGLDVTGQEGLELLRRVGDHERHLGGLGAQAEEGDLDALAGDGHHGGAEVGLGDLAAGRLEWHEYLTGACPRRRATAWRTVISDPLKPCSSTRRS